MKRFSCLLLLVLWTRLAGFSQQSAPAPSTPQNPMPASTMLAGVVVRDGTNQPLNHVLVTITKQGRPVRQAMYLTAADGRFAFSDLPPGKYSLTAMKEGYPRQSYQQLDDEDQYSTAIAVGPQIDTGHLVFPLKPPAALSGNVLDDRGDPVGQAQVHLFRKHVVRGKLQITQFQQRQTDLSGGFSFDSLPPGLYLIAVFGQPWYNTRRFFLPNANISSQDPGFTRDLAYPLTYYPDTTDPASAAFVDIHEGDQSKVQLTLRGVPAAHIRIAGVDLQNGKGINAQLFAIGPNGAEVGLNMPIFWLNGQASSSSVPPGRYRIAMMNFNQAGGMLQQMGSKLVDLSSGDTTIDFNESQKISVSGKLTLEGNLTSGRPMNIVLMREYGGPGAVAPIMPDGSFKFENSSILPGQYTVQMGNATGFYLKSVTATGAKYLDGTLEINSGDVQLAVIATSVGLKKVEGVALKDDKPFPGAMVLLLPKNGGMPSQIRRDQSDSDGTFTLQDVIPGEYFLFAIDDGRQFTYREPSVIKPYLAQSQTITVPTAGPVKVQVLARQK